MVTLSGGDANGVGVNLQACTGECDTDAECAPGLRCFNRQDGEAIPGCTGPGGGPSWDYCFDPTAPGISYTIKTSGRCDLLFVRCAFPAIPSIEKNPPKPPPKPPDDQKNCVQVRYRPNHQTDYVSSRVLGGSRSSRITRHHRNVCAQIRQGDAACVLRGRTTARASLYWPPGKPWPAFIQQVQLSRLRSLHGSRPSFLLGACPVSVPYRPKRRANIDAYYADGPTFNELAGASAHAGVGPSLVATEPIAAKRRNPKQRDPSGWKRRPSR